MVRPPLPQWHMKTAGRADAPPRTERGPGWNVRDSCWVRSGWGRGGRVEGIGLDVAKRSRIAQERLQFKPCIRPSLPLGVRRCPCRLAQRSRGGVGVSVRASGLAFSGWWKVGGVKQDTEPTPS